MGHPYLSVEPVQKEFLHAKIADAIMDYIKDNNLKNGDKLPSERLFAESFNTSRNSVREALKVLEANGIVEALVGRGTFVKEQEEKQSFYLKIWEGNYLEILEMKEFLEVGIVHKICGKLTEEQLKELEEILLQIEEKAKEGVFYHCADIEFHRKMRRLAKNETVNKVIEDVFKVLQEYWRTLYGEEAIWISTIPYHRELYEGLAAGDMEKAVNAVRRISEIDKNISQWMQKIHKG